MRNKTFVLSLVLSLVLILLLACVSVINANPAKNPPPGCNGDIKVHKGDEEPSPIEQNHPKVECTFHLHGFNFDPGSEIVWYIKIHPDTGEDPVLSDILIADANGEVRTELLSLLTNMYKVFWHQTGCPGGDKHKVFQVECEPPPEPTPTPEPPGGCNEPPTSSGCAEGLGVHEGVCRSLVCPEEATCECPKPTPTPTPLPTCNQSCTDNTDCDSGQVCHKGKCRNSACTGETTCECPEFVSEPGTLMLLGSGLAGLAGYATLKFRKR